MNATLLHQFCLISGLDESEILQTLEYLPLSTEEAFNFYLLFNRWPNENEASFIADIGWYRFEYIVSQGIYIS